MGLLGVLEAQGLTKKLLTKLSFSGTYLLQPRSHLDLELLFLLATHCLDLVCKPCSPNVSYVTQRKTPSPLIGKLSSLELPPAKICVFQLPKRKK